MTLDEEKRYLLLLSSYYCFVNNIKPTKCNVLDIIVNMRWINLTADELKYKTNRNELVWRNDLAYVRKHLVMNKSFENIERDNWAITTGGRNELRKLHSRVTSNNITKNKITTSAINYANSVYPF